MRSALRGLPCVLLVAAVALGAVGTMSGTAFAQDDAGPLDCEVPSDRGPREVVPASGARNVPTNAWVEVRFSPDSFDFIDPETTFDLRRCGSTPVTSCVTTGPPVEGSIQAVGDSLFFLPSAPLATSDRYAGTAVGIDRVLDFDFRTGTAADVDPPVLERIEPPSTASVPVGCSAPEGGYRVDVSFPPATDDGSPGSIEYLLYLTRATGLEEPELRSRVRNFFSDADAGTVTMAFVLTPEESVAPACFVVHAVDGVGNVNTGQGPVCFEPVQGNFFAALCTMSPGSNDGGMAFGFGIVALMLARRRRARG